MKRLYEVLARQHGVKWKGRRYDSGDWDAADLPNRCLSQATACLYGLAEAAILARGLCAGHRVLHTGKPQSFVYDVADVYKFETVVPIAFRVAGQAQQRKQPASGDPIGEVRRGCRDSFRKTGVLSRLIPGIEEMLTAGGWSFHGHRMRLSRSPFLRGRAAMLVIAVNNAPAAVTWPLGYMAPGDQSGCLCRRLFPANARDDLGTGQGKYR